MSDSACQWVPRRPVKLGDSQLIYYSTRLYRTEVHCHTSRALPAGIEPTSTLTWNWKAGIPGARTRKSESVGHGRHAIMLECSDDHDDHDLRDCTQAQAATGSGKSPGQLASDSEPWPWLGLGRSWSLCGILTSQLTQACGTVTVTVVTIQVTARLRTTTVTVTGRPFPFQLSCHK